MTDWEKRCAELEAENADMKEACDGQFKTTVRQRKRAEQAEAALNGLKDELSERCTALLRAWAELAEKQLALDSMERDRDLLWDEKDKALAELAALKARRCTACRWYEAGAMDPASCGVLQGFVPHNDFWCCDWAAHAEEGGE